MSLVPVNSKVAFRQDVTSRYQGVYDVLQELLHHEEVESLINNKRVVIKPNLTSSIRQLASTHTNAVRAVLDVILEYEPGEIIIAEGSGQDTKKAFANFGYYHLSDEYKVQLLDLNEDDYELEGLHHQNGSKEKIKLSKTILESDCRISVAIPKTHDTVIMTGAFKNMVMGSIVGRQEKNKMHQGYPFINKNIALLGKQVFPHLGILDGFIGMEGNGPVSGSPVEHRIALAGTNSTALDAVCANLMGFSVEEIGYLVHAQNMGLGELNVQDIKIIGDTNRLSNAARKYKPHRTYKEQKNWKTP